MAAQRAADDGKDDRAANGRFLIKRCRSRQIDERPEAPKKTTSVRYFRQGQVRREYSELFLLTRKGGRNDIASVFVGDQQL